MADVNNRLMNPWVLHLQKLGLELKCPLCLDLLNQPVLLPCDHVFCDSCIRRSSQIESSCPVCITKYSKKDRRNLCFLESVLSIYKSLNAAVSIQLPRLQSSNDCNNKNARLNKSCNRKDGRSEDSHSLDEDLINCSARGSLSHDGSPPPTSQESNPRSKHQDLNAKKMLDSLPSYDSMHESDNDVNNHTPESYRRQTTKLVPDRDGIKRTGGGSCSHDCSPLPKSQENSSRPEDKDRTVEQFLESLRSSDFPLESENDPNYDVRAQTAKRVLDITASEAMENHLKVSKKPRSMMYKSTDIDVTNNCTANLNDQLTGKTSEDSDLITSTVSDQPSSSVTICGFCQSSKISEATGKMLHYSKGRPVIGDDIFRSNVIHVHSECIEWAPQVYYEADTVKNLKAELARGMKIKCTKCGLKGAALGCYVKSCRRSYHVPCAREISRCRWDNDDFLLLCPAHSSVKFPTEKSRPRAPKADPLPKTNCDDHSTLENKPAMTKDIVLCGSALSPDEKHLMEKLAVKINATISKYWNPKVTHVIASTNEKGACTRTLKVLMGILNGKWIINSDWIKASLEASKPVNEEQFEINLDTQGCQNGPKTARLRAASNKPKLFNGMRFYLFGDFFKGYKEDLQNLVKVAGGKILNTENEIHEQESSVQTIVVYNIDPPRDCELSEEVNIIWKRANEAEGLGSKIGAFVVGHTWLLESIAGYKLHPLNSLQEKEIENMLN